MTDILDWQSAEPKAQPTAPGQEKKKYTKRADGVIIGPDGKPCRTCNSLTSFLSATTGASTLPTPPSSPAGLKSTADATAAAGGPPDVEQLGRASWTLLHSLAATYPKSATNEEQKQMGTFMRIFARVYPCGWCGAEFDEWMGKEENRIERYLGGRREFGNWMCRAHNDVNKRLGKKEFDCSKWMERWGGKDE